MLRRLALNSKKISLSKSCFIQAVNGQNFTPSPLIPTTASSFHSTRYQRTEKQSIDTSNDQVGSNGIDFHRKQILQSSLQQVHEYGWSDEAVAQAVLSLNYPPSYIGFLNSKSGVGHIGVDESDLNRPHQLITYFMKECNQSLEKKLDEFVLQKPDTSDKDTSSDKIGRHPSEVLEFAIRSRLEMNIPYIESSKWHEAMALGAMYPTNAITTIRVLDDLVEIIAKAIDQANVRNTTSKQSKHMDTREKAVIGALYVATELHMLTDKSLGYIDTWIFLKQRVQEIDQIAGNIQSNSPIISAGSSVLESLFGAATSICMATAKSASGPITSFVIPQLLQLANTATKPPSQRPNKDYGTQHSDYVLNDLPPFEDQSMFSKANKS